MTTFLYPGHLYQICSRLLFSRPANISYSLILRSQLLANTTQVQCSKEKVFILCPETNLDNQKSSFNLNNNNLAIFRRRLMWPRTHGGSQWSGWSSKMSGEYFKTFLMHINSFCFLWIRRQSFTHVSLSISFTNNINNKITIKESEMSQT